MEVYRERYRVAARESASGDAEVTADHRNWTGGAEGATLVKPWLNCGDKNKPGGLMILR